MKEKLRELGERVMNEMAASAKESQDSTPPFFAT
jgi:hypothetical protein